MLTKQVDGLHSHRICTMGSMNRPQEKFSSKPTCSCCWREWSAYSFEGRASMQTQKRYDQICRRRERQRIRDYSWGNSARFTRSAQVDLLQRQQASRMIFGHRYCIFSPKFSPAPPLKPSLPLPLLMAFAFTCKVGQILKVPLLFFTVEDKRQGENLPAKCVEKFVSLC